MKRIFSVFLSLTILNLFLSFSGAVVSAAEDSVTASYESSSGSVEIVGCIGSEAEIPVTVCITENAETAFSDTHTPIAAYVIYTSANGAINDRRTFEGVLPSGVLTLMLTSQNGSASAEILVFREDDDGTKAVLKEINTEKDVSALAAYLGENNNIEKLGFRYAESEKYLNDIAGFCISQRAKSKQELTLSEAIGVIHYALFMCEMKNGGTAAESMQKHYTGFDCSYAEFAALSDEVKAEFCNLINAADYLKMGEKVSLKELVSVSKARLAAASWAELKKLLTENAEEYDIAVGSGSTYAKVAANNRQNVFYNMLSDVKKAVLIRDISAAFEREATSEATKKSEGGKQNGGSGGGTRPSSSMIATAPTEETGGNNSTDDSENANFADVKGHFSEAAVKYLTDREIVSGYPDQSFRPNGTVTRAEFAMMIYKAFAFPSTDITGQFSDVSSGDWFSEAVNALSQKNILLGDDTGFRPNENITRQDAAVILKRVFDEREIGMTENAVSFTDEASISGYAEESVKQLAGNGIIQGSDGEFRPLAAVTRGESAVMLYRMLTAIA